MEDKMSYHTVIVVGRLGRDPEMRYTASGEAVTSFSLATDRQYTDSNGQRVKETMWFRVSVWGKQAETCNAYLKKGKMALVEGRLQCDPKTGSPRIYDRQDGTKGTSFEISANTVRFLSSKGEGEGEPGDFSAPIGNEDDSIPF